MGIINVETYGANYPEYLEPAAEQIIPPLTDSERLFGLSIAGVVAVNSTVAAPDLGSLAPQGNAYPHGQPGLGWIDL
jgi:hypothetical protein